ncbi:hypothetical protein ACBJ59_12295 [Nonomuraea sp. MTCD27]|uniref:hypothetical protein n=1 Tax=Nonomuraea sp. MTCD27 TaxID=1676747 RepID=UPI0035BFCDB9
MSLTDWLRDRRDLIDELTEAREQAVAAGRQLQDAAADRDHFMGLARKEREAHEQTQRILEALESDGCPDVFGPAIPRTPGEEWAARERHVAALEEQVHRLQQANMAADRR